MIKKPKLKINNALKLLIAVLVISTTSYFIFTYQLMRSGDDAAENSFSGTESSAEIIISNPDISENIEMPFNESEVFPEVKQRTTHSPSYEEPVDLDGDGTEEQILFVPTAMNHGAGEIWIIKNNFVIFRSTDRAGRAFEPAAEGSGFYLIEGMQDEKQNWNAIIRTTKYEFQDNMFVPVSYKDVVNNVGDSDMKAQIESEEEAVTALKARIASKSGQNHYLIESDCPHYSSWDRDTEYFQVEIREKHSEKDGCPGDPQTMPLLAMFRVYKDGSRIDRYDIVNDIYSEY